MQMPKKRFRLSAPQIVVLGFAGLILLGAILLMLPISSASGEATSFVDAFFTSTTSVCVTGLIVQDTGSYWSTFGHAVILLLIQIGGLGVITVAASFTIVTGRKIGLFQRGTMQEAVASPKLGGVVRLTGFLLKTTLMIELLGAIALAPAFVGAYGWGRGIWMSVFTSISAFCNAGIDLFGKIVPYSSVTAFVDNPAVNIALMALIVVGGLGFLTWDDIRTHGIHFKRYRMQSKVILLTSLILIVVPAVGFFFLEFADMPLGKRIWASLFQSVTTRTAGFASVPNVALNDSTKLMSCIYMFIGGASGSTAGGIKVGTVGIILFSVFASAVGKKTLVIGKRTISWQVVQRATALLFHQELSSVIKAF